MQSNLPTGWSSYQAPDGRWYFAHAQSGVTQWHHPGQTHSASIPQGQPTPFPLNSYQLQSQYSGGTQPQQHPQQMMATASGRPVMSSAAARFVLTQPTEFKLQEKAFSLSGDSFTIKRVDTGESYFKVKGNALSLKDSKTLLDMNGASLYKMTEALVSLRGRMYIIDPISKQPVITLRKKGFIPGFGSSTIQAWSGGTDEGDPYLEIKGDFLRKDFSITEKATGRTLASIKRKSFNLANIILEKDSYVIRVEPGQDTALLIFFVVAADEHYRDDGNRRGISSFL